MTNLLVDLFAKFGLPVALLVVFLGIYTGYVASPLARSAEITVLVDKQAEQFDRITSQYNSVIHQNDEFIKLLTKICVNTARNEMQQMACLR